jgi:hypothetical protein
MRFSKTLALIALLVGGATELKAQCNFLLLGVGTCASAAPPAGITLVANGAKALGNNGGTTDAINSTGANFCALAVATDAGVTLVAGDISDSTAASWTLSGNATYGAGARIHVFWAVLTGAASHTFTVTKNSSFAAAAAQCFSGVNATPYDQQSGDSASGTIQPASALTPSVDNSLVVSALATTAASTLGTPAGYTKTDEIGFGSTYGVAFAYVVQGAATSTQPAWTSSAGSALGTQAVVFKPS